MRQSPPLYCLCQLFLDDSTSLTRFDSVQTDPSAVNVVGRENYVDNASGICLGGHSAAEYRWLCEKVVRVVPHLAHIYDSACLSQGDNALASIDPARADPDVQDIVKRLLDKIKFGKFARRAVSGLTEFDVCLI